MGVFGVGAELHRLPQPASLDVREVGRGEDGLGSLGVGLGDRAQGAAGRLAA